MSASAEEILQGDNSDAFKSMEDVCHENGWATESYTVTTEDGYILDVHRIPGKLTDSSKPKPAVLLQHGLDCDMMMWVFNSPELAPAFILAENGFDVWMGNNRGNRYSMGHTSLSHKHEKYWDFSQEELGLYDAPAIIDLVIEKTG